MKSYIILFVSAVHVLASIDRSTIEIGSGTIDGFIACKVAELITLSRAATYFR